MYSLWSEMLFNRVEKLRYTLNVCSGVDHVDECANCGEKHPEYALDERKLCFDCYRAERFYWAKEA